MPDTDIDLLVQTLRAKGHNVRGVHHVPENAGEFGLIIDDRVVNLDEAREILERDERR